ncbi:TetR/AcrR family transcriptional regulator [Xanthomonas floridensis]|uniref:TetR family transcriptional regulator n=1 Tax=Xanthomonas floridensis TaxID=1843580 RepID=A0A1A9M825_9XANT|nr:TetR family transcriptional regulator [Xanthomonas floridensis]MEA5124337.1 TetR family transcriptional regulator [Xanthomonas floridensis]MEA5131889.1 TetR family transcriptional regulator [Xanthomonas floridensis]OAG65720.1 TetR family transcriptional regulator [Xanthomonas floridensis]
MKVSKAQAQANRTHVVETASRLFRERGYDGVGVADLMAAAGFTHGGFYKQFRSKADLMAESAACGLAQTAAQTAHVAPAEFVNLYVSRAHRDDRASGCTMAALATDAARQPEQVRAAFAQGIEHVLAALDVSAMEAPGESAAASRARKLDMMAHAIGAIVMSRACPDDGPLADEILAACRSSLLASMQQSQNA